MSKVNLLWPDKQGELEECDITLPTGISCRDTQFWIWRASGKDKQNNLGLKFWESVSNVEIEFNKDGHWVVWQLTGLYYAALPLYHSGLKVKKIKPIRKI